MTMLEDLTQAAMTRAKVGETLLAVGAALVSGVATSQEAEQCLLEVKLASMWLQCAENLEAEVRRRMAAGEPIEGPLPGKKKGAA